MVSGWAPVLFAVRRGEVVGGVVGLGTLIMAAGGGVKGRPV